MEQKIKSIEIVQEDHEKRIRTLEGGFSKLCGQMNILILVDIATFGAILALIAVLQ